MKTEAEIREAIGYLARVAELNAMTEGAEALRASEIASRMGAALAWALGNDVTNLEGFVRSCRRRRQQQSHCE